LRNYIISFILFFSISSIVFGQETIFEEKTTIYDNETSGGIGMHTNGFMGTFRYGKYLTGFTKLVYEIEVANIKHPKEIRSINPFENDVRGYVFGKLNYFYPLRPSVGFHKTFVPKQSIRGVSIGYILHGGLLLGIAKPVYLNVQEDERGTNNKIIVSRKYDPEVHQQIDIYGRASFLNGFDELKLYPGFFGKFGFHFDYSQRRESIRGIEVGLTTDIFLEEIPLMAFTDNSFYFLNIYVEIFFGSRKVE
jgi:hypothetical protein